MKNDDNHDLFENDHDMLEQALQRLDNLPQGDDAAKHAWPKLLIELVDVMASELKRMGETDGQALKKARRLVAHQANYFGGRMVYLPNAERLKLALRDMDIYSQYKGGNSRELSEKFGLTQQQVCSIVSKQHGLHRKRVQPGLF
ncbi:Mor transcription activator family protein [Oceanobacter sp. 4_MG-2023]|uniref:Mor transcription activator family protein n=1 Tax=Oceanobacter sp. 4_MG-2023 TaxID=3062623 RepID=UPI002732FCE8|nr:Mor transcription activator family protein [Oceanobacter sp. 4_MG-2023]MDP2548064.1 Mor transcription activator family protein [Oceanobacter sp. 4_MG-2023]